MNALFAKLYICVAMSMCSALLFKNGMLGSFQGRASFRICDTTPEASCNIWFSEKINLLEKLVCSKDETISLAINARDVAISANDVAIVAKDKYIQRLELDREVKNAKYSASVMLRPLIQHLLSINYPDIAGLSAAFEKFGVELFLDPKTKERGSKRVQQAMKQLGVPASSRLAVVSELKSFIHNICKPFHFQQEKLHDRVGFYCAGESPMREAMGVVQ
jgi:hypothetical protein